MDQRLLGRLSGTSQLCARMYWGHVHKMLMFFHNSDVRHAESSWLTANASGSYSVNIQRYLALNANVIKIHQNLSSLWVSCQLLCYIPTHRSRGLFWPILEQCWENSTERCWRRKIGVFVRANATQCQRAMAHHLRFNNGHEGFAKVFLQTAATVQLIQLTRSSYKRRLHIFVAYNSHRPSKAQNTHTQR